MATPEMMEALRSFVPEGPAAQGKLVGWHFNVTTNGSFQNAVVLYSYAGGKGVVVTTTFERMRKTDPWQMTGFNLMPATPDYNKATVFETLTAPPPKTAPAGS